MVEGFDGFTVSEEIEIKNMPLPTVERAALASALADEGERHAALVRMREILHASDFSGAHHGAVWDALLAVQDRNDVVDAVTVAHELETQGYKDAAEYIFAALPLTEINPAHCETYAGKVAEHAYLRAVRAKVSEAHRKLQGKGQPLDVVSDAREALAEIPDDVCLRRDDSLSAAGAEAMAEIARAVDVRRSGGVVCAKWGIPRIDGGKCAEGWDEGALGGLYGSRLYLLGGVPEAGKTSMACAAALATSIETKRTVLIFSLEMSRVDLATRLMIQLHNRTVRDSRHFISENRVARGALRNDELASLSRAHIELAKLPIKLIEDHRSLEEIRARALAENARSPVALIVVDFLQLVELERRYGDDLKEDKARVYGLKKLTNALRAPLLAITSMSKGAQTRAKDGDVDVTSASGDASVAYAADVMAFLVRTNWQDEGPSPEVQFIITKRRGGYKQTVTLRFQRAFGTFESIEGVADREARVAQQGDDPTLAPWDDGINAGGGDAE